YSQPYWLVKAPSENYYVVDDQTLIGLADSPPAATVRVRLSVDGAGIELARPIYLRYADRAEGERVRPLVVVPPIAVNVPGPAGIFPDAAPRTVRVSVRANVANAQGELRMDLPAAWKAQPASRPFRLETPGEQQEAAFQVTPPAAEATAVLRAVATIGGRE